MNVYFFLSNSFNVISDFSENEYDIYEYELFETYKQKLILALVILCILYLVNTLLFLFFSSIAKNESLPA